MNMDIHMESPVGAHTTFNGREMDYFAGCGYLGLQSHPSVIQAAQETIERFGLSTASSRGEYGEHSIYDDLERELCAFFSAEKMIYFASGYMGMSILTQATGRATDHIFIDADAHFSLWDAAYATNKPITVFHHLQPERLEDALRKELYPRERPIVLSDGVFPISGEIAPLPAYLELAKTYGGLLYVDDAHAVGVLGKNGRGTTEYYGIQDEACHACATLSKALGGWGGVISGKAKWVEDLDRHSSIMEGASPPPLVMAAASARALHIARTEPMLLEQLWKNVTLARDGLRGLGWKLEDTPVPIICLRTREGISLQRLQTRLFEQGLAIKYVRHYSSTPTGGALRIAIFATHTVRQIERLIEGIGKLL